MAAMDPQVAAPQPKLRWYQVSLRGLLLLVLFAAIFLSILAVGRTSRVYEASLGIHRQPLFWTPVPDGALKFHEAVQDMAVELAASESVMEAVAQSLQLEGIATIDSEDVSGPVIRKHIALKRVDNIETWGTCYYIVVSSSDSAISKAMAVAYFRTWFSMMPRLAQL